MKPRARRLIAALAGMAAFALAAGVANASPAQTANGDVTSGPFHIVFHAQRAANAPANAATGTFDADTKLGPLTLMTLHGPVTCLEVRGNQMGLFYPIASSTPPIFSMLRTGIFIYLTVDGAGHATNVQFLPVPIITTTGCAPLLPPLLPATGSAVLTS